MMVVISYDVNTEDKEGRKRLRHVAKECLNYGQRVQKSVFECLVDPMQFKILENKLEKIIDEKKDSLRFYFLGSNWRNRVKHIGFKVTYDPEGELII